MSASARSPLMRPYIGSSPGRTQAPENSVWAPLWRADPRSKLDAAPLTAALRSLAASRGVELADLANGHERLQRQLEALPRSRKVSAATAERICRMVLGRAIREVLAYLEREAVGVRRGHNGTERHKGLGFTAAAFDHRTSREGDPQWHTHVLVQNATLGPDQRWTALDSKLLHAHAMAADRLYLAALRAELTQRLDVRWRQVNPRTGAAEIDGLHDPELLRAFSKRRAQVLALQA